MKVISGYTCETAQNMLLDSGAVFKNFVVETDTFETAVTAGKLLGATRGGSTFSAVPETRMRVVDGLRGTPKGGIAIDSWAVTLLANFIEVTPETLKAALGAAEITDGSGNYTVIKGRSTPKDSDYYDNITWIGTLNGSDHPVIIQVYNAMSTTGINMSFADKNEAVVAVTFNATYDTCGTSGSTDLDTPPFAIFYPKASDIEPDEEDPNDP